MPHGQSSAKLSVILSLGHQVIRSTGHHVFRSSGHQSFIFNVATNKLTNKRTTSGLTGVLRRHITYFLFDWL